MASGGIKKTLLMETEFVRLVIGACVLAAFSTVGLRAQQTAAGNSSQQSQQKKPTAVSETTAIDLVSVPLPSVSVIQLPSPQTPETSQDLDEERLAKLLFDRRSTLPDSPNPKIAEGENSMCPSGVGSSCALLGGWVYYPDKIGLTYHNKTWWEAMKNPGMIAISLALIGTTVLDIEGSQACIDKHTCRELNPLGRGPKATKYAIAMPINALAIWAAVREKQHGRPTVPIAILWAVSATHFYFGVDGLYQARGH